MTLNIDPDFHGVVFASPLKDGVVVEDYLASMCVTIELLCAAGIQSKRMLLSNDAFIHRARNKLAGTFLRQFPKATDLFWIDADVGWTPKKVLEFLKHDQDIVAGIYPKKNDFLDFPVEFALDSNRKLIERNGLIQATAIPMGFTRMKRHVVEMLASCPTFYEVDEFGTKREYPWIFEVSRADDGRLIGEDNSMCRKWLSIGGEIWVDAWSHHTHTGSKKWEQTIAHHLHHYAEKATLGLNLTGNPGVRDTIFDMIPVTKVDLKPRQLNVLGPVS